MPRMMTGGCTGFRDKSSSAGLRFAFSNPDACLQLITAAILSPQGRGACQRQSSQRRSSCAPLFQIGNPPDTEPAPPAGSEPLEKRIGFGEVRELPFFRLKLRRVHAAPAASQLHRMLQVQHLVVDDVFDGVTRERGMVEDAADDDGVVRGIVVAENAASLASGSSSCAGAPSVREKARVQVFEDRVQVVEVPARRTAAVCARASAVPGAPCGRSRGWPHTFDSARHARDRLDWRYILASRM